MRADWYIDFGRNAVPVNRPIPLRENPDNNEWFAIQFYHATENALISVKMPLPETVAQNYNLRLSVRPIFAQCKGSAESRNDPKDGEKIGAYDLSTDFLQVVSGTKTQACLVVGSQSRKQRH